MILIMENKERQTNTNADRAQKEYMDLIDNSMAILPEAVVYEFSSTKVEETVMRWLEAKGINTNGITIRCVLKNRAASNPKFAKDAARTQLPFLVILFKELTESDGYIKENDNNEDVKRLIRRSLNNFRDSGQFRLKEDTPLNNVLSLLNGDHLNWSLHKKSNRAFITLDSDAVTGLCFKKKSSDFQNYILDFLTKPQVRTNNRSRYEEFYIRVAFARNKPKKKPSVDPINFIR